MPDVAAGLAAATFTLLGLLAALFGLLNTTPTVVSRPLDVRLRSRLRLGKVRKSSVKAVPDKPISQATEIAPVAPAGEAEAKALDDAGVDVPVKKRATRSAKD